MKNVKKLTVCAVCALSLVATSVSFASCVGESAQSKVMTVGLNPQVEFVLDGENKVVSVNALNDEGNLIITAEAFASVEGMTAEDAAKLFVQVSKDSGFVLMGSTGVGSDVNEFSIAISGETAESLYQSVKGGIESYCTELDIDACVGQLQQITKEDLESLVEECAPYFTQAEVQAMSYAELVQEIADSREETAEMFSQELKNAYYEAKAYAVQQAEIDVLKSKVDVITQALVTELNLAYTNASSDIETMRNNMLLAEHCDYQKALAEYRAAKVDYLNFRNYVAGLEESEITLQISQYLTDYKDVLDAAESYLLQTEATINATLDEAKNVLTTAYNAVVGAIESASVSANNYLDELNVAKKDATAQLTVAFETEYSALTLRVESDLETMRTALLNGYTPVE